MTEELVGAIRNALERGASLDLAVKTLINAGYNPLDVNEAAKVFTQPSTVISSSSKIPANTPKSQPQLQPLRQPAQQSQAPQPPQAPPQLKQQVSVSPLPKSQAPQQQSKIINQQIQQAYPQIASTLQPAQTAPSSPQIKNESKQTIAILLVILVLILGIIMLLLMFKDELLNLIT